MSARTRFFALVAFLVICLLPLRAAPAQQAERVAVGDQAIDFTLQSVDGETFRLADLRGEKNAILIFFRGTW